MAYAYTRLRGNIIHEGELCDVEIWGLHPVTRDLFGDWELDGEPDFTIQLSGRDMPRETFDQLFPGEFERMLAGAEWELYIN